MSEILSTSAYFVAVSRMTRFVFDGNSGEQYSLRPLFFQQRFAEGRHAFLNYADLQSRSLEGLERDNETDITVSLRQLLRPYAKSKNEKQVDLDQQGIAKDILPRIKSALMRNKVGNNLENSSVEKGIDFKRSIGKEEPIGILQAINDSINNTTLDRQDVEDSLFEDDKEKCNTLVFADAHESRIIIFAGAGYGKSTLIQRIALAYSNCKDQTETDLESDRIFRTSIEESNFEEQLIPCVIELRKYLDCIHDIEGCILQTVRLTIGEQYDDISILKWIHSEKEKLLLLVDGLDELPTERALPFLSALDEYLQANDYVRVIMTTRIAGIDDGKVNAMLRKMKFHGRTIMPLDEGETRAFCEQWISVTHDSNDLIKNLDRIQSEPHLSYLREFMRKPLELVMLLHYIPKQSFSSFNRWELFYNILWAEITSHVQFDDKQSVYDDECKFLGFIAYQMQMRNKLLITFDEIVSLLPEIQSLSFYSDLFDISVSPESITADEIWIHLKYLAQNLGIVEIIEGTRSVTMPIRSYQEYLTAYACCNLCLIQGELYPNPQKVLAPHLNEASWLGVLGFAIAGMEYSAFSEFDEFLSSLYSTTESITGLCTLMETDYFNSRTAAKALCRIRFRSLSLEEEKIRLIQKCMASKSTFSFRWALTSLYRASFERNSLEYLEAISYAYLFGCLEKRVDPLTSASSLLESSVSSEQVVAAKMLIIMARIKLEEEPIKLEDVDELICRWGMSERTIKTLYTLAVQTKSYVFVQALTELWISQIDGFQHISNYLCADTLAIACDCLSSEAEEIAKQVIKSGRLQVNYVHYLKNIINMIGAFSYEIGPNPVSKRIEPWIKALVFAFYEISRDNVELDQIGIAVCAYHIDGSFDELMQSWAEDICKGRSSCQIRKEHLTKRENNHFLMVRDGFVSAEEDYFSKRKSVLNTIDEIVGKSPTQLFISGEDFAALDYSIKLYQAGEKSNNNNFAFLVRYLHFEPDELFGIPRLGLIQSLLNEGVTAHEAYSTINYALTMLEEQQFEEAKRLIATLSAEDIRIIAEEFWHPIMWEKRGAAEGAFVCILAHNKANLEYLDYAAMLDSVRNTCPLWMAVL